MVLGVCRRVLQNPHDAEDAFQAAFLVLLKKAHSIRVPAELASWLHGVAYRVAIKARAMRQTLRKRESNVESLPETVLSPPDDQWAELEPLLDQEVDRLPDKYQLPIVLCELEGLTTRAAAKQLGWPEGTVSGRLSRARVILAQRMRRRGFALSGAALTAAIARNTTASIPAPLFNSTIHDATLLASGRAGLAEACSAKVAVLMKGVPKSMLIQKLKLTAVSLAAVGVVTVGALSAIGLPTPATPAKETARVDTAPPRSAPAMSREQIARELAERDAAIATKRKLIAMGNIGAADPDTAEIEALMKSAQGHLNWDQAKHEIDEKHANIARAKPGGEDPAYMAEVEALMTEARGDLTFAQAKHEIDEKHANIERAAKAEKGNLSPEEIERRRGEDRAKTAAEKGK